MKIIFQAQYTNKPHVSEYHILERPAGHLNSFEKVEIIVDTCVIAVYFYILQVVHQLNIFNNVTLYH